MAIFFAIGLFAVHFLSLEGSGSRDGGVFGGPHGGIQGGEMIFEGGLVRGRPLIARTPSFEGETALVEGQKLALSEGILKDGADGPLGSSLGQGGVLLYKVKKGNTLSGIAADFGISVQTLIGANPEVKSKALQIGQELNVLPVSGALYSVREGETAESIAAAFGLTVNQLKAFNPTLNLKAIGEGTLLVIPGAHPLSEGPSRSRSAGLPNLTRYFMTPAEGFNWGRLHDRNAVDIANTCGTEIHAAAEGLVIDATADSWNFGYGRYLIIEHPNGTKTRYAHLEKLIASIGDYVAQGEVIGAMGQTGEATGCHLHFEVEGAQNPLAR